MKKNKGLICLCTLLSLSLIATGCGKEIEVKNGSKVAVSIKGEKFTASEYYDEIKKDNISILVDMIDESILAKDYKETDEEKKQVDAQIEQVKTAYGSDAATYERTLKYSFGVESEKELREKLQLEYRRNEAVKDYVEKNLTDKEINDYYKDNSSGEIKASHILIAVDVASDASEEEKQKAEEKALKKAKDIIKKLKKGEDFSKLAKKNSDDEGTAEKGGDLGYFQPDEMVEEFSKAAKDLKVDEYTKEPVKTQYGYHIILKTGEKDKPKLKEVKEEITETLRDQKLNSDVTLYYTTLSKIREEKKISWNDSALKEAYEEYMDDLVANALASASQSTNG